MSQSVPSALPTIGQVRLHGVGVFTCANNIALIQRPRRITSFHAYIVVPGTVIAAGILQPETVFLRDDLRMLAGSSIALRVNAGARCAT